MNHNHRSLWSRQQLDQIHKICTGLLSASNVSIPVTLSAADVTLLSSWLSASDNLHSFLARNIDTVLPLIFELMLKAPCTCIGSDWPLLDCESYRLERAGIELDHALTYAHSHGVITESSRQSKSFWAVGTHVHIPHVEMDDPRILYKDGQLNDIMLTKGDKGIVLREFLPDFYEVDILGKGIFNVYTWEMRKTESQKLSEVTKNENK